MHQLGCNLLLFGGINLRDLLSPQIPKHERNDDAELVGEEHTDVVRHYFNQSYIMATRKHLANRDSGWQA